MKGFSSKHIELKVDVTEEEKILFAGASVHLSDRKLYRLGSEGVKLYECMCVRAYMNACVFG